MSLILSFVVTVCAIPIIRSLRQLERNTREIINHAKKFDSFFNAIKSFDNT